MPRWFRTPLLLKYLLAVALVQGMTVLLLFAWWHTGSTDVALTLAALGLAAGFFAALWLASIARGDRQEALLRAEADLIRERERNRHRTERERSKAAESARRQVQRETRKVKNRSTVRLGAAVAGIAGLGTVLLLTQFLSLGVLLISSSGGALAGYLLRMRQEFRRATDSGGALTLPRQVQGERLGQTTTRNPERDLDP
ncbi:MAG TPA: hypothetical protein VK855_10365 [Thioalkalivibrio sp.]|nr:hypothetical protein [Thioalkalivibrio sp.]